MKISKKRLQLILQLERIIGAECYNANVQNWGPGGTFEGEGRDFRYPITFVDKEGIRMKRRIVETDLSPEIAATGHYSFGANQLHIIRALNKILEYLEERQGMNLSG
jgi:hypothetical protein